MVTREKQIPKFREIANTGKISSSVSFRQYFQVFRLRSIEMVKADVTVGEISAFQREKCLAML